MIAAVAKLRDNGALDEPVLAIVECAECEAFVRTPLPTPDCLTEFFRLVEERGCPHCRKEDWPDALLWDADKQEFVDFHAAGSRS